MKYIITLAIFAIAFTSCSKSKDDNSVKFDITQISGNYSGQALTWENNDNGNKTSGSDGSASLSLTYIDANKVNVVVNSSAALSQKTYQMNLIGKTEDGGAAGYIYQLLDASGDYSINTLLKITVTTSVSATLEYTRTLKSNANISDRYKITGYPDQK